MVTYGVTAIGFVIKTLQDIIDEMEAEAILQFGADIDLTSTSPIKKFIQVIAAQNSILWETLEDTYYAGFFDFAVGVSLDNLVALIGMSRTPAIKAVGSVTFTGVTGTIVPMGTQVQTIAATGASAIVFKTTEVKTLDASGNATSAIIAVTGGIAGNVQANTITVMTLPLSGVSTVNNASALTGGEDAESDAAFRNRIKLSLSSTGAGTLDAIRAGVLAVPTVTSCTLEENETAGTVGDLPPKSFRVTVLGGTDDDIAQAILDNKPAGIQAYSTDQSGNAVTSDGTPYLIWFNRAQEVPIYVTVTLTTDSTFPADGLVLTETALIDYIGGTDALALVHPGIGIGGDVIYNELIQTVMGIQGVTDAVATSAITPTPTGTSNISINPTQKAITDTTKIIVSLNII